jgi:hypothetical protein
MQQTPPSPAEANQILSQSAIPGRNDETGPDVSDDVVNFLAYRPLTNPARLANLCQQLGHFNEQTERFARRPGPCSLVSPSRNAKPRRLVPLDDDLCEDLAKSWQTALTKACEKKEKPVLMDAVMEGDLLRASAIIQHIRYKMNLSAALTGVEGGYAIHIRAMGLKGKLPKLEGAILLPFNDEPPARR